MVEKIYHSILAVDDEEQIGKSIARLLKKSNIDFVYVCSGEEGLAKIEAAQKPFSLIISDERMPGMLGHEFLEKAKELLPDTTRFLLTAYSDIEIIIDAVNKGSIHKYILKPWDTREFLQIIRNGIKQYEGTLEYKKLLRLSKEQNRKLHQLYHKLKDKSKNHKSLIAKLERDSENLNLQIKSYKGTSPIKFEEKYWERIETLFQKMKISDQEKIRSFYCSTINELSEQFKGIAERNRFEMSKSIIG